MAQNKKEDESIPIPPAKEVLDLIQKQISSKKQNKEANIEDIANKPRIDISDIEIKEAPKSAFDHTEIQKPTNPFITEKKPGLFDKFFNKDKKIVQIKPVDNLEKSLQDKTAEEKKSQIQKPESLPKVINPSIGPTKKEGLFQMLFSMQKKAKDDKSKELKRLQDEANTPFEPEKPKEPELPEIPIPPNPEDIGMESADKALEDMSKPESAEKELLKKIAQSSLEETDAKPETKVEMPIPAVKEEIKEAVKPEVSKPVAAPEIKKEEEPEKEKGIIIKALTPLPVLSIPPVIITKNAVTQQEEKKSDLSPDSPFYKDFLNEQKKVDGMQKDLERQFDEMEKRRIEFQSQEDDFLKEKRKQEEELLDREKGLTAQQSKLDKAQILHEQEKQELDATQEKLKAKEETLRKWDIEIKAASKELKEDMKVYEKQLTDIESLKTNISKEFSSRKELIEKQEKELLDRAAVVEKKEGELHQRSDALLLKENTIVLKEKDITLKDSSFLSKERMLNKKEITLAGWEEKLKRREADLTVREKALGEKEQALSKQMDEFAKYKVNSEHDLTVMHASLTQLQEDLEKKEADIPQNAKNAFLDYEQKLKASENEISRREKDLEVEDEALDFVEKKYKHEKENLEENEFQFYMKQKLSSPADEDEGIQTDHISKLGVELSPPKQEKKIFLLINNCKDLIKGRKLDDAKKLYNAIRDEYYRAELSISEKKDYFDQIKELYDDIQLADLKKR